MGKDPRENSREETASEVDAAHALKHDKARLTEFWNERFRQVYGKVLESNTEIGRHGVIAEVLNRTLHSATILDVGCGTGILAELLDLNRINYVGLDISPVALEIARSKRVSPQAKFQCGRIEDFKTSPIYGAVVFNEVLYYLDIEPTLELCRRILVPPRIILISIYDFPYGRSLLEYVRGFIEDSLTVVISNPTDGHRWTVISGTLPG